MSKLTPWFHRSRCVSSQLWWERVFLWRRPAVSFSISPDLCCIDTSSADFFPPRLAAAASVWKRCFCTWVSEASAAKLSLSLFLSLPAFYFSVKWYHWCNVNVMKFLLCVIFLVLFCLILYQVFSPPVLVLVPSVSASLLWLILLSFLVFISLEVCGINLLLQRQQPVESMLIFLAKRSWYRGYL